MIATGIAPRLVTTMTLWLPGDKPLTRKEPLLSKGRPYPHPDTSKGLLAWWGLWAAQGRLHVEGPVILECSIRVERPKSHRTKANGLTSVGRKYPVPIGFDVSNVIKLVEDALKGHAFGDDSLVVSLHGYKRWANTTYPAGTEVSISRSL